MWNSKSGYFDPKASAAWRSSSWCRRTSRACNPGGHLMGRTSGPGGPQMAGAGWGAMHGEVGEQDRRAATPTPRRIDARGRDEEDHGCGVGVSHAAGALVPGGEGRIAAPPLPAALQGEHRLPPGVATEQLACGVASRRLHPRTTRTTAHPGSAHAAGCPHPGPSPRGGGSFAFEGSSASHPWGCSARSCAGGPPRAARPCQGRAERWFATPITPANIPASRFT